MHNIILDTIGTDPEFFMVNKISGEPYSPVVFTKGTKDTPEDLGSNYFLMSDNLTLEGNVPPAKSEKEFIDNMKYLKKIINQIGSKYNCQLYSVGELEFDAKICNSKQGKEYGCSSVNYAWQDVYDPMDGDLLSFPQPSPNFKDSNIRTAGFHIHIGYTIKKPIFKKRIYDNLISKLFDLFLTIPANIIYSEPYRLGKFGYPGNYRTKEYGVECRTLSSFFTQDKYLPWVYNQLEKLFLYLNILDEEQLLTLLSTQVFNADVDGVNEHYSLIYKHFEDKIPGVSALIKASTDVSLINSKYEKTKIHESISIS